MTLNLDTTQVPQLGAANTFTNSNTLNVNSSNPILLMHNTGAGDGVDLWASGSNANGIYANAGYTGVYGTGGNTGVVGVGGTYGGSFSGNDGILAEGSAAGVWSLSNTDSYFNTAIFGAEYGSTQETVGIEGYTASPAGLGIYGQLVGAARSAYGSSGVAIWGDTNQKGATGVLGSIDDGYAGQFVNNSPSGYITLNVADEDNTYSSGLLFYAESYGFGGLCAIDVNGNLGCTGTFAPVVSVEGGSRKLELNSISSPESWFEDFGSGQLSNGKAVISIEPTFLETINTEVAYHVFLTPNGESRGLYVSAKSPTSFEVREQGGGTSDIDFDYRIVAKRRGFESVRLEDKTAVLLLAEQRSRQQLTKAPAGKRPTPEELRETHEAPARRIAQIGHPLVKRAN